MLPYVNKPATLAGFIKYAGRVFARRVFGLDVRTAASRRYDLHGFEYHYKYLSRFMHFEKLLANIKPLTGSIVECGVGPGRSLFDFAVISVLHNTPRHIIGFDTFCGIPDATPQDGKWNAHIRGTWSYPVDHVRENLLLAGLEEEFIRTNITLIPGEFSQSLPAYKMEGGIAFLHIDVDLYESYRTVLEHLYDHVVPGGIIAFDEYGLAAWPGATRAIDEFFEERPEKVLNSPVTERYWYTRKGGG